MPCLHITLTRRHYTLTGNFHDMSWKPRQFNINESITWSNILTWRMNVIFWPSLPKYFVFQMCQCFMKLAKVLFLAGYFRWDTAATAAATDSHVAMATESDPACIYFCTNPTSCSLWQKHNHFSWIINKAGPGWLLRRGDYKPQQTHSNKTVRTKWTVYKLQLITINAAIGFIWK